MNIDDKKLGEILLRENYLSPKDLSDAEQAIKENKTTLSDYVLSRNLITNDLIGQAVAESLGVAYSNLSANQPSRGEVEKIPEEVAKKFRAILFHSDPKTKSVTVTTDDPRREGLLPALTPLFPGATIAITYSLSADIDQILSQYQKPLETRFSKILDKKGRMAPEFLGEIFSDALAFHASDIHFEPQEGEVLIRFRVDGVLQDAGRLPREHYENILNRIKVQSRLRIDEHFSAQDGSLRYEDKGTAVDFRTSIVPTVEGEKIVLRILAAYVRGFSLEDLGLSPDHQEILSSATKKPFGMILVVGPTGSGKTTTLYALLKMVNNPRINITTIEDPVEYKVVGVNQIQVNPQTNLTFAQGLRSIVRQDPDIILVGEIRDNETAEIAVNAALTGHLLYSTFHANDSATAIPRLLDMGIEPFLLASTLEVVVAQRLVRKICQHCKHSVEKSAKDFNTPQLRASAPYFKGKTVTLYEGKKCDACGHTGYKGRTALFEFIRITPQMQNLILRSPSSKEIGEQARAEGSRSLFEDGVEKVRTGITTLEELLRVAEPPQT